MQEPFATRTNVETHSSFDLQISIKQRRKRYDIYLFIYFHF